MTLTQTGGYFDTQTNGPHAALVGSVPTSPSQAVRVVVVGFAGDVIGQPFIGYEGAFTMAYEVLADLAGLQKANATHTVYGQQDKGVVLQNLAAQTADWNTKSNTTYIDYTLDPNQRVIPITSATKANPCVVTTTVAHGLTTGQKVLISGNTLSGPAINSDLAVTVISTTTFSVAVDTSGSSGAGTGGSFVLSSTVAGGAGYQHVTACTGFTNFVGKIKDSPDDVTYTDVITFADNVVAPFAERKTYAGTLNRYVCYDGNITGSGSISAWAGIARS